MDSAGHPKTVAELAKKLGGKLNGEWVNIPGPHHSQNDYSLGIILDPNALDGFRVHSFSGNDPVECKSYVLQELSITNLSKVISKPISSKSHTIKIAQSLWDTADQIAGTAAHRYLKHRCFLDKKSLLPTDLRFSPSCHFGKNKAPALIGKMVHAQVDTFLGIHRTAICAEGTGKLDFSNGTSNKMMLGCASCAVIKLSPFSYVLGIAEGIETALSASSHFNIPVWAVLTAGGMARFPIIPNIQQLIIFADNDHVGEQAADQCAKRYYSAGVTGEIRAPPSQFKDWNNFATQKHKEFIYDTYFRED
jgi:putative DNA primase/helicase